MLLKVFAAAAVLSTPPTIISGGGGGVVVDGFVVVPAAAAAARRRGGTAASAMSIASLLEKEKSVLDELEKRTEKSVEKGVEVLPFVAGDDAAKRAWLLRFLASGDDLEAAVGRVEASIDWRLGEGLEIVRKARTSFEAATSGGGWDNDPVLSAAPFSEKIAPFVGAAKLLTLRNAKNDGLVYAIRAGEVDDKSLMAAVTPDELAQFFLYAKAVNEIVCAKLAAETNELSDVVTVNDLKGVDLFGDATFRQVLSRTSKRGDQVFPGLAGPTILLNLPPLARALVKIFKPLFPKSVQNKLKFAEFDLLDSPEQLLDRASPAREAFLTEIDAILAAAAA
ncbi:hypothetical protein CTAYLR_001833 [Chrysophaeum taylorii]|uniref:CRAL-TRIO domain-containing protein n=1 Tax=Chrysophaeum taylorii TaxID=2483200 RepID=A0AAD7UAJ0_9STRA|nr:hypothetical protein CTAYLR_001833 [Chrysophaeum taylorii]